MKLCSVLIALWIAAPAAGQSTGANIAGIVTDESGARLMGATVTIAHTLNGRSVTVTTGSEGEYRAVALLPGEYDLVVTHSGFAL